MGTESVCAVCGNEVDPLLAICPYCGQNRQPVYVHGEAEEVRVVNLERGMPVVRDALKRLELELESAARAGCRALVLIHGYGSSGKGGVIRAAVRERLQIRLEKNTVSDVLPGEECSKRSGHVKQIIKRFPSLKELLERVNPGITVVVI